MTTQYKIYMVFESLSVEGKYIPLLYTATDELNANAILPSDSTTYTFPSSGGGGEKEELCMYSNIGENEERIEYSNIRENEEQTEYSNIGENDKITPKKRCIY